MLVLTSVKVIENKVEDEVNVTLEVEVTIEKVDVTKEDDILACFAHALDLPGDLHPLLVVDGEVPILQLLVNQV